MVFRAVLEPVVHKDTALNDMVKRALHGAGVPSVLEPLGLDHGESIHPDGLRIVPYKNGRSLTWDCACVDTFAESHVNIAIMAVVAATDAENMKCQKYAGLSQSYIFEPIAIETTGVCGQLMYSIIHGRRLAATAGDEQLAWFK